MPSQACLETPRASPPKTDRGMLPGYGGQGTVGERVKEFGREATGQNQSSGYGGQNTSGQNTSGGFGGQNTSGQNTSGGFGGQNTSGGYNDGQAPYQQRTPGGETSAASYEVACGLQSSGLTPASNYRVLPVTDVPESGPASHQTRPAQD